MDVTFNCPSCKQQLEADVSLAGSQIACPSCNTPIEVPEASAINIKVDHHSPAAQAKEEHHFSVPNHEAPPEALVKKAEIVVEAPVDGIKKLKLRTIRRTDCVEVGRDRFDETVSELLGKIGESNIVSMTPITYTHVDISTRQMITDFGVMIAYKG